MLTNSNSGLRTTRTMGPQGGWFFHKAATFSALSPLSPFPFPLPFPFSCFPLPASTFPGAAINVNETHWNVNMTFNASMGHARNQTAQLNQASDGAIHVSTYQQQHPPPLPAHYTHGRKSAKSWALNQLAYIRIRLWLRLMGGRSRRGPAKSGQKLIKPLRATAANESSVGKYSLTGKYRHTELQGRSQ